MHPFCSDASPCIAILLWERVQMLIFPTSAEISVVAGMLMLYLGTGQMLSEGLFWHSTNIFNTMYVWLKREINISKPYSTCTYSETLSRGGSTTTIEADNIILLESCSIRNRPLISIQFTRTVRIPHIAASSHCIAAKKRDVRNWVHLEISLYETKIER